MSSAKELLAQKLKQNTQKHQSAQQINIKELKELKRNVPIEDISHSPYQPRKTFNEIELNELADSIEEIGLLQPITIRKLDNLKYELIAGERRLRAHERLKKTVIEAIIIDVNDDEASLLSLAENLKRQDLTDFEIFFGLTTLDESLKKNKQRLARSLGLNREDMYKYLSFEVLPEVIIADLNAEPSLLGRFAATAFKKFLSDYKHQEDAAHEALLTAWNRVKNKQLNQTKAAAFAEKLLLESNKNTAVSLVRKIEFHGKTVGNIKSDNRQLKISLNVTNVDEKSIDKIEKLLQEIIESKKV